MKLFRTLLLVELLLSISCKSSLALTLPVSEDTSSSPNPTIAKVAGRAARLPVSASRNGLIRFDAGAFSNSVPSTNVASARLILYVSTVLKPGAITVHRVTKNWSEVFNSGPVVVPSFDPAPLAAIAVPAGLARQFVIIDVTATVKEWLADPASDFGFAFVSENGIASVLLGAKEGPAAGYPATLQIEAGQIPGGVVASSQLAANLSLGGMTFGNFSGNLFGNASSASAVGGLSAADVASGASFANAATALNTADSLVRRDQYGNFSAGMIAGTFIGNGAGLTNVTAVNGVSAASLANVNAAFMEFVRVGNPGNPNDTADADSTTPGLQNIGAVAAPYLIGKYEVTNAQYARFLNAVAATDPNVLYRPIMGSDARGGIERSGTSGSFTYTVKANMENKPVIFIHFADAIRFCNWLHNGMPSRGQDSTTTEDGAYLVIAETYPGTVMIRKPGAKAFLPTESEWYKAAYYDPAKGATGGYWAYPTRSDVASAIGTADAVGNLDNPSSNVANYASGAKWNGQTGNVTTVGSGGAGGESACGAADMAGNVFEWNETVLHGDTRGLRSGSWASWVAQLNDLRSSSRYSGDPDVEQDNIGFRVARP